MINDELSSLCALELASAKAKLGLHEEIFGTGIVYQFHVHAAVAGEVNVDHNKVFQRLVNREGK